jgi:hypothetical protein
MQLQATCIDKVYTHRNMADLARGNARPVTFVQEHGRKDKADCVGGDSFLAMDVFLTNWEASGN